MQTPKVPACLGAAFSPPGYCCSWCSTHKPINAAKGDQAQGAVLQSPISGFSGSCNINVTPHFLLKKTPPKRKILVKPLLLWVSETSPRRAGLHARSHPGSEPECARLSNILDKPSPDKLNLSCFCEDKTLLWFPQEASLAPGYPQDTALPNLPAPACLGFQKMLRREECSAETPIADAISG